MPTLEDAIQAIKIGTPEQGRLILEELLEVDENNEEIWLWLSAVVDTDEDREICLENVLALDPENTVAKKGLDALQVGAFGPHLVLDEILEIEEDETPDTTFIDDFVITEDDDSLPEDDELEFPSTMAATKPKKSTKGCTPNPRIILVLAVILVIVMALGGLAAFNLFLGGDGDNGGPSGEQLQEVPADGGGGGEQLLPPTATDTPTPTPTNTPTPTLTPFRLPTPKPTLEASPTATQVVAPTPGN